MKFMQNTGQHSSMAILLIRYFLTTKEKMASWITQIRNWLLEKLSRKFGSDEMLGFSDKRSVMSPISIGE